MADAYLQKIVKIIDNLYSSGPGSSAGSSSGASVGMGASSVISEATSISSLAREISASIEREFAAAMEAAATLYKGSISHSTLLNVQGDQDNIGCGAVPAVCLPSIWKLLPN
jgi:hypothetical protein